MNQESNISRREWFSRAAMPALAASFAFPLLANETQGVTSPTQIVDNPQILAKLAIFDIRDFGAVGDGIKLNTKEIQAAIDAAHAAQGGTVLVPAGTFLCGTIELKSNVTFHLVTNAKLLGSPKPEDYHAGKDIPPGNGNIVFISAANAENVTISGNGTIDGNGLSFWTGVGDGAAVPYVDRPHTLIFFRVKNLRVQDVFLNASAYHCMRILNCEYVYFERIRIYNRVNKNNDGFHFNNTQYVHIDSCDVKCQDDACALFGSNKFVTVSNCSFSTRWSIFRFGGGECENIAVTNCLIYETFGCVIKMNCGARSRFENMTFSNLILRNVTGPFSIGLNSVRRESADGSPQPEFVRGKVRNITFSNIRGTVVAEGQQFDDMHWEQSYRPAETRTCITFNGVGEDIMENISLSNIHLTFEGGGTAEEAQLRDVPQVTGEYYDLGPCPAHGVYARNVRGLTLDNVRIETTTPDLRPALFFDNVADANITGLVTQGNPSGPSVLRCINTKDTLICAPRLLTPAAVFLAVEGQRSADITLDGGDIRKAAKPTTFERGATEKAAIVKI